MAMRFAGGTHYLEHVNLGGIDIEIDGALVFMLDSGCGDVTITDGSLFLKNSDVGAISIVDGSLIVNTSRANGGVTMASALGNLIRGTDFTCEGMTLTGGSNSQEVVINGLRIPGGQLIATGTFYEFNIENLVIGRKFSSTVYSSGGLVDLDGLDTFRIQGTVLRAFRTGVRIDDCDNWDVDLFIEDSGIQADNTYDAVSIEGTSARWNLRGAVRGASNTSNNPRYGVAVGASCLDGQIDMDIQGCQTGEINNAAGLEVSRKVRISTETLTDGDVLVWDGTGLIFRPDDGSGIGGASGLVSAVSQIQTLSKSGELDVSPGTFRLVWPFDVEIQSIRATVGVAPTGDDLIIDALVGAATIFPTTPNPQVDDGEEIGDLAVPDDPAVTAGVELQIDILQVGSTDPGEDLTVIVEWRVA